VIRWLTHQWCFGLKTILTKIKKGQFSKFRRQFYLPGSNFDETPLSAHFCVRGYSPLRFDSQAIYFVRPLFTVLYFSSSIKRHIWHFLIPCFFMCTLIKSVVYFVRFTPIHTAKTDLTYQKIIHLA
jgi:hypothetical protein